MNRYRSRLYIPDRSLEASFGTIVSSLVALPKRLVEPLSNRRVHERGGAQTARPVFFPVAKPRLEGVYRLSAVAQNRRHRAIERVVVAIESLLVVLLVLAASRLLGKLARDGVYRSIPREGRAAPKCNGRRVR